MYYPIQYIARVDGIVGTSNYTVKLFEAQLKQLNLSTLNTTYPATLNSYINKFSSNPKSLATLGMYNYNSIKVSSIFISLILITIGILFLWSWIEYFLSPKFKLPTSKIAVDRFIRFKQKGDARLRAHNYTESDIQWFHATTAAIISFRYLEG